MNDSKNPYQDLNDSPLSEEAKMAMRHCPVARQANNVVRSSKETLRAIRRLRRSLLECQRCPAFVDCELREQFNQEVDVVIAEILDEWGWS